MESFRMDYYQKIKRITMEKLLFCSSVLILLNILFVDSEIIHSKRIFDFQCADYSKNCNPYSPNPCCNQSHECEPIDELFEKVFICTGKVQLGHSCEANEDCDRYISHSECLKEKKCSCKSGYMETSKVICLPLLGEICENNEKCGPANSICFDDICECDEGYLQRNKFKCSPALLGTHCSSNTDCEAVKYAECSVGNVCTCVENTIEINPSICTIDQKNFNCELDSQCEENALCILGRCRCKPGLRLGPDHECISVYVGMSCESDEYCSSLIKYSICSSQKKCQCDDFHYPTEKSFCVSKINEACKNSETCKNDIIFCINDECHCQPHHIYNGSDCVLALKN